MKFFLKENTQKQTIFYLLISIAILIFAVGYIFSKYIEYKQFKLLQNKTIEDCVEKSVGSNTTGFSATIARQRCVERFSE